MGHSATEAALPRTVFWTGRGDGKPEMRSEMREWSRNMEAGAGLHSYSWKGYRAWEGQEGARIAWRRRVHKQKQRNQAVGEERQRREKDG